jgi:hypothetical protein
MMKRTGIVLVPAFLLCAGCLTREPAAPMQVENRPVSDWVDEVVVRGAPNHASDVLYGAGVKIVPELGRLVSAGKSLDEQVKAAYFMGCICALYPDAREVREVIPVLTRQVAEGDRDLRIYSIQALGAIGRRASGVEASMIKLTRDDDAGVRGSAVEALGRIGADSPEAVAALMRAVSDPSNAVRGVARKALENYGRDISSPSR